MVETLFFDLDNTLLDFNRAERAAIAKTLKNFHIAPEPSVLKRYSELNLSLIHILRKPLGYVNKYLFQICLNCSYIITPQVDS